MLPENQEKSGWSLPLPENARLEDAETIDMLYRFYAYANEELYKLMTSLGPSIGWKGRFTRPSSSDGGSLRGRSTRENPVAKQVQGKKKSAHRRKNSEAGF